MKKLILFLFLVLFINYLKSQSCLPEGIHFKTQQEIDDFSSNYPYCTKIEGSVIIDDTISGNIKNLLGLTSLTHCGGFFTISNNDSLLSLSGLENLDSIGYSLTIRRNNSLIDISAFESLTYISSAVFITENPSLLTLEGFDKIDTIGYLSIIGNESLQNLSNLENLTRIRTLLHIENNQSLNNLLGLENLVYVGEDLKIFNNNLLTDLQGLNNLEFIQGFLKVRFNDQLISLEGLENIDTIVGGLSINDNIQLSSLESLENTYYYLYISIHDNPSLAICDINSICDFISSNPENIDIDNNSTGCNSIEEVEELCLVSVQENSTEPMFRIYPNPTENKLSIINLNCLKIDNIYIYNSLSQIINIQINTENKIDISGLSQGIYIIEILSNGLKYKYKLFKI